MSITIWIENIGKDIGGQLTLPTSRNNLETFLTDKLHFEKGCDELEIIDCIAPFEIEPYESLSDLNVLAAARESLNPKERDKVERYLEEGMRLSAIERANVYLQHEEIPFYAYKNNLVLSSPMERYGIDEFEDTADEQTKERWQDYIDYEAIGRDAVLKGDVRLEHDGYFTNGGCIDFKLYTAEEIEKMTGIKEKIQDKEIQKAEPQLTQKPPQKGRAR